MSSLGTIRCWWCWIFGNSFLIKAIIALTDEFRRSKRGRWSWTMKRPAPWTMLVILIGMRFAVARSPPLMNKKLLGPKSPLSVIFSNSSICFSKSSLSSSEINDYLRLISLENSWTIMITYLHMLAHFAHDYSGLFQFGFLDLETSLHRHHISSLLSASEAPHVVVLAPLKKIWIKSHFTPFLPLLLRYWS